MTWFNVVKNESIEAKNKAKEFARELKKEVEEGITMTNGEPYSIKQLNTGFHKMHNHFDELFNTEKDIEEKIFHADEMFVESGYFTRSNGLRQRVLDFYADLIKTYHPEIFKEVLSRRG